MRKKREMCTNASLVANSEKAAAAVVVACMVLIPKSAK